MKKLVSLLLALCLLLASASALADVDLSYLEEYPDVFQVSKGDTLTFICDTLTAADLAFDHPHSNGKLYSFTYFSLWIPNGDDTVYPMLDVIYCADEPLNITSVSFDVAGVRYTFAVETDEPSADENGVTEDCRIYLGVESFEFLNALTTEVAACETDEELFSDYITATLHGDEDLTVTLASPFLLDYYLIMVEAFTMTGGLDNVSMLTGATAMTMETIPVE